MKQQFTNQELQILKSLIRRELRDMNQNISTTKHVSKILYRAADKEVQDVASVSAFTSLNDNRNWMRSESERARKFEKIQKKIKVNLT